MEESHKNAEENDDIDIELEREIEREHLFEEEQALCLQLENDKSKVQKRPLTKVSSLPSNFTYSTPVIEKKFNASRRQTVQYFNQNLLGLSVMNYNASSGTSNPNTICESAENDLDEENVIEKKPMKSMSRKSLLNKFKTQSFDVKLLSDAGCESHEFDIQNSKFGQSNLESISIPTSSTTTTNASSSPGSVATAINRYNCYIHSSLDLILNYNIF